MGEELVDLCVQVGAVIEDDIIGSGAFFVFVHLLCHAGLDLLSCSLIALDGSLETKVMGSIDFNGDINGVLESRFEEQGTFLSNNGTLLLFCPSKEVLTDNRMDDGVHLGDVSGKS